MKRKARSEGGEKDKNKGWMTIRFYSEDKELLATAEAKGAPLTGSPVWIEGKGYFVLHRIFCSVAGYTDDNFYLHVILRNANAISRV